MGTKNHPGQFDCYEAADPDEPMFVLLARDPMAPSLVREWAARRDATSGGETDKTAEARACATAMDIWRDNRGAAPNSDVAAVSTLLPGPRGLTMPDDTTGADSHFLPYYAVSVEGTRIGLATCARCGAVIILGEHGGNEIHEAWHDETAVRNA